MGTHIGEILNIDLSITVDVGGPVEAAAWVPVCFCEVESTTISAPIWIGHLRHKPQGTSVSTHQQDADRVIVETGIRLDVCSGPAIATYSTLGYGCSTS